MENNSFDNHFKILLPLLRKRQPQNIAALYSEVLKLHLPKIPAKARREPQMLEEPSFWFLYIIDAIGDPKVVQEIFTNILPSSKEISHLKVTSEAYFENDFWHVDIEPFRSNNNHTISKITYIPRRTLAKKYDRTQLPNSFFVLKYEDFFNKQKVFHFLMQHLYEKNLFIKPEERPIVEKFLNSSNTNFELTKTFISRFVSYAKDFNNYSEITNKLVESQAERATTWQDLKYHSQKSLDASAISSFANYFKSVEVDPDIDLHIFEKLSQQFKFIQHFLLAEHRDKISLRFRKLGNYKALGLYFHLENEPTIAIDINNHASSQVGQSALFHEFAHFVDYALGEQLDGSQLPYSMSHEFAPFLDDFDKLIKAHPEVVASMSKGNGRKSLEYFKKPTEVFARGFETYLNWCGFDSSFNSEKEDAIFKLLGTEERQKWDEFYERIFNIKAKLEYTHIPLRFRNNEYRAQISNLADAPELNYASLNFSSQTNLYEHLNSDPKRYGKRLNELGTFLAKQYPEHLGALKSKTKSNQR